MDNWRIGRQVLAYFFFMAMGVVTVVLYFIGVIVIAIVQARKRDSV